MKRYSVLYLLNEQYRHVFCATQEEASAVLQKLRTDQKRIPVGVYDAKTELVDWDAAFHPDFSKAPIGQQGMLADQVITIAQALRRRDSSWQPAVDFRRPSFFA